MRLLGIIGLFLIWCLILMLAGVTWVTWSIQKVIISIIVFLGDRFFPETKHNLDRFI